MPFLKFTSTGETEELEPNSSVKDACERQGVPFACEDGLCGTCICYINCKSESTQSDSNEEGVLSEPTEAEIDFLGPEGVKKERMMCQTQIIKGTVIVTH